MSRSAQQTSALDICSETFIKPGWGHLGTWLTLARGPGIMSGWPYVDRHDLRHEPFLMGTTLGRSETAGSPQFAHTIFVYDGGWGWSTYILSLSLSTNNLKHKHTSPTEWPVLPGPRVYSELKAKLERNLTCGSANIQCVERRRWLRGRAPGYACSKETCREHSRLAKWVKRGGETAECVQKGIWATNSGSALGTFDRRDKQSQLKRPSHALASCHLQGTLAGDHRQDRKVGIYSETSPQGFNKESEYN